MNGKYFTAAAMTFFLAGCGTVWAEVIKSKALLKYEETGQAVISLDKDVQAECVDSDGEWKETGFVAYLDPAAIGKPETQIKKGSVLYDKSGKVIGKALETFPEKYSVSDPDPKTGRIQASIVLLANSRDIRPDSIIEISLQRVLKTGKLPLTRADLAVHMKKFGYSQWSGYEGTESFLVYENWMQDPSPGFRVVLIFRAGKLSAILHSRNIDHKFAVSRGLTRHDKISYLLSMPEAEMQKLEKFYSDILKRAD